MEILNVKLADPKPVLSRKTNTLWRLTHAAPRLQSQMLLYGKGALLACLFGFRVMDLDEPQGQRFWVGD